MTATEELPTLEAPGPAREGPLVLGRYRMGRRIGAGGFGSVHEALDLRLDREVAVKVIPTDGPADDRVRREARAAARLDHPGIVAIHDAGEEDGCRYLVSELVRGRTLSQLQRDGELSDRDVLRVGLALADALEHAHERGVIHRDVKPQNVIVPEAGREPAKLTDFGVAFLAGDEPLTRTGDVVGTLAYMAPEQAAGERVDDRADLYSLALVLYEALSGSNPVRLATPAATVKRIGTVLPPLGRKRKDLPGDLCAAIDQALAPDPEERGELADLADALAEALPEVSDDGGTVAPHPIERGLSPAWARPAAALGAAALAAGVVGALGGSHLVHPGALAAAVAVCVALSPAIGWLVSALAVIALVGSEHPETAVLLAVAYAAPPLMVRNRPQAWSLPGAAPALGLAGLAGAFPALAGRARSGWTRMGLGAAGACALVVSEVVLDRRLLLGPPEGPDAAALAGLWGLAALVLPWVVRGRTLAVDVVTATMWAAGLAAATASLATALGRPEPAGLVAGAAVAGLAAAWRRP